MYKAKVVILKEIMDRFNEYRAKWIEKYGNDSGFNEWFTRQVLGKRNLFASYPKGQGEIQ